MSDESPNETSGSVLSQRWPIIALAALIVVSLLAVCGLGYALLGSNGLNIGGLGQQEVEPTPFSEPVTTSR